MFFCDFLGFSKISAQFQMISHDFILFHVILYYFMLLTYVTLGIIEGGPVTKSLQIHWFPIGGRLGAPYTLMNGYWRSFDRML